MSIWNTHSKSMPQEVEDVFFFNATSSAVTPLKGQLLQFTPGAVYAKTDGVSTAIKCSKFPDIWGKPTDVLPLEAKRHLVGVASASRNEVAGVLLESPGAVAADSGVWVKVVKPGSYAQCLCKETTTVGATLIYDISLGAFKLDDGGDSSVSQYTGAGVITALEVITWISGDGILCWAKLRTGDAGASAGINVVD